MLAMRIHFFVTNAPATVEVCRSEKIQIYIFNILCSTRHRHRSHSVEITVNRNASKRLISGRGNFSPRVVCYMYTERTYPMYIYDCVYT